MDLVVLCRRILGPAVGGLHRRADHGHRAPVLLHLCLDADRRAYIIY